MTYRLSLAYRTHVAARRKERYHGDPAYRLARINDQRRRSGLPVLASLEGVSLSRPVEHRVRDEQGRFS